MNSDIENAKPIPYQKASSENSERTSTIDLTMNSSSSQISCPLVPNEYQNNRPMEENSSPIKSQSNLYQNPPMGNLPFQNIEMNQFTPMQNMARPMMPNQMQPNPNNMLNNNRPIVVMMNSANMPLSDWKASLLCSCFSSAKTTACSILCPCIQYGINRSKVIQGSSCVCGCFSFLLYAAVCPCIHPCCIATLREKLRASFNIDGSFCEDCCAHLLCPCCALIQEARELELRNNNQFNNFIQMN